MKIDLFLGRSCIFLLSLMYTGPSAKSYELNDHQPSPRYEIYTQFEAFCYLLCSCMYLYTTHIFSYTSVCARTLDIWYIYMCMCAMKWANRSAKTVRLSYRTFWKVYTADGDKRVRISFKTIIWNILDHLPSKTLHIGKSPTGKWGRSCSRGYIRTRFLPVTEGTRLNNPYECQASIATKRESVNRVVIDIPSMFIGRIINENVPTLR